MTELTFTRYMTGWYVAEGYTIHKTRQVAEWTVYGAIPEGGTEDDRPALFVTGSLANAKKYANAHANGDLDAIAAAAEKGTVWNVTPDVLMPVSTPAEPAPAEVPIYPVRKSGRMLIVENDGPPIGYVKHPNCRCQPSPDESTPAEVPQSWVDQLVSLVESGAAVYLTPQGWRVNGARNHPFLYQWERVDATARAMIAQGIARKQLDRLHLVPAFREQRAAARGIVEGAIVRYRSPSGGVGTRRYVVERIDCGEVKLRSLEADQFDWWPVERAVFAGPYPNPDHCANCGRRGNDPHDC